MPASGDHLHVSVAPADAAQTVPGVYLSSSTASSTFEPLRTGTPVFLGVQGIDRVLRLDSRDHNAITNALQQVTGKAFYAIRGFFANGGHRCYPVPASSSGTWDPVELDMSGLGEGADDFDLVCAPDLASSVSTVKQLAQAHARILAWCARDGRRFAILDTPRNADELDAYRQALTRALRGQPSEVLSFGAGYHPWLQVAGGRRRSGRTQGSSDAGAASPVPVPPCGHIAGIYSRSDRNRGVWAAPANEVVVGAVALDGGGSEAVDPSVASSGTGLNAICSFRKRGIRVWGARTLYDSDASGLRYVTARRTLQAVMRRLQQVLTPIVFEPDTPLLWTRVNRIVSAQLDELYRSGALAGATAGDAYFVRCDADTNSPQTRAQGQVVAEAGIAVVAPAEFITIDIRVGGSDPVIFQHVGG